MTERHQQLSAGSVVVPREPTREMWAAMGDALVGKTTINHDVVADAVYQAILSSAPAQPAAKPVAWMNREHIGAYMAGAPSGIAWASSEQTEFYDIALYASQPSPAATVEAERRYTEKEVSETVEKVISGMLARGEIADTRAHNGSSADTAHVLNEWADLGSNALQWLKNIKDGVSTAEQALEDMQFDYDRVLALSRAVPQPLPKEIRSLVNEIAGVWGGFEPGLRQEIGNTNYNVLQEKLNAALALSRPAPQAAPTREEFLPRDAWNELVDKDDRTSPEEYPDMCLISFDELKDYMERHTVNEPQGAPIPPDTEEELLHSIKLLMDQCEQLRGEYQRGLDDAIKAIRAGRDDWSSGEDIGKTINWILGVAEGRIADLSRTTSALSRPVPQSMPESGLTARGVGRMFDNEKAVLVIFDRKLTDDELRALHDQIRILP